MIDERSLTRAMKESWRGAAMRWPGTATGTGGCCFWTGGHGRRCCRAGLCSRKVLALLAEHLGEIPEASAYRVRARTRRAEPDDGHAARNAGQAPARGRRRGGEGDPADEHGLEGPGGLAEGEPAGVGV